MAYNHTNSKHNLEEFRRYRDGEMSFREQHDLEKSLLEDTFLAEAYEGFLAMSTNEVPYDQSISELNDNLQNRIKNKERKILMLWIYASAASIVVGLGVIWLVYFSSHQMAERRETVKKTVSVLSQPSKIEEIELGNRSVEIKPKKAVNIHSEQEKEIPEPSLAITEKKQAIQIPDFQKEESLAIVDKTRLKSEIYATPSQSFSYAPTSLMQRENNQFVTGHVTDENGDAVAGASIQPVGNKGAQTDSNGNFKLSSRIGDSLTLAMIGYKAKSIRIAANNIGTLKLEADNQMLNEVVIVGYGKAKKSSNYNTSRVQAYGEPVPVNGWESYEFYLDKMSDSSKVKGVVKVSFFVNSNGSFSDFKPRGTSELFEKAINIITSGPAWKPFISNQIEAGKRVEVTINFKTN